MEDARLALLPRLQGTRAAAGAAKRPADLSADAEVFWELAGPHKKKLYNFISKALSFSEQADDVFQETLLRGWKYFGTYKKDRNFGTWLFAIAHNEVRRHLKAARRQDPLPLWEGLAVPDNGLRHYLVREVYLFAAGLKPRHKEIFFLFYDSGFSVQEISRITGLREGNVKFILNRVRRTLRELLGEEHGK